jgi:hypothetical protein
MDIFSEKACFKKPVLPEKPAFNLPAGFFNGFFQALTLKQFKIKNNIVFCNIKICSLFYGTFLI